ncbi:MAG TPA: 50S ribosomal protein L20 [Candidatus Saccharimonadales bacterium]|jgi:large subunit ribosomal protein L20
MRSTYAVARAKRVKKIKRATKGMSKTRQKNLRMGRQAIIRAGQYQYRDRRNKKRDFRQLWITRINAAARLNNTTYAKLIKGLKDVKINLNRKVLSELAVNQPEVFAAVVKKAVK